MVRQGTPARVTRDAWFAVRSGETGDGDEPTREEGRGQVRVRHSGTFVPGAGWAPAGSSSVVVYRWISRVGRRAFRFS